MKVPGGTLVLVADGEKALFLRNVGDERSPNLQVERRTCQENPPTGEQGTDRPGRMPDTGVRQRSAMEETDWHMLEKDRFAAELADMLYRRANANDFDRLVVCAAPHTLGELRRQFHKIVAGRIIGEIDKDLTNMPVGRIEHLLGKTS